MVRSCGRDYIKAAFYPLPQSEQIESEYPVPVRTGPESVMNIHNQIIGIKAQGQPA